MLSSDMLHTRIGVRKDLLLLKPGGLSETSGGISISGAWDYEELWYHLLTGVQGRSSRKRDIISSLNNQLVVPVNESFTWRDYIMRDNSSKNRDRDQVTKSEKIGKLM